jgi:hypothetical protein
LVWSLRAVAWRIARDHVDWLVKALWDASRSAIQE